MAGTATHAVPATAGTIAVTATMMPLVDAEQVWSHPVQGKQVHLARAEGTNDSCGLGRPQPDCW